ncbi:45038_t:CDS:2 [Gigaspora margarita]|uniref:45038_t:CDS:1 n=1 Tax=Gigaspora margarita TaxID=4874 RepID=A0ABN7WYT4_GIGMA|nr:45038_t:CDS:2 [Gigaspora margarita]
MLNLDKQQIKSQFLQGLSSDLENDAEHISTEQLLADLFEILERIEMRRAEKKLGLVSKIPHSSYKSSSKLIIPAQSQPVSSQSTKKESKPRKKSLTSSKSQNKSTVIDKSLQKIVLDMLDGIAPVD